MRAFVFVRAITYATLFAGLLLVFLPARILESSRIVRPATLGRSSSGESRSGSGAPCWPCGAS